METESKACALLGKPLVFVHLRYAPHVLRPQCMNPGNYRPCSLIQSSTITLAHSDPTSIHLSLLEGSYLHLPLLANPHLLYSPSTLCPYTFDSSAPISSFLPPAAWRCPSAPVCAGALGVRSRLGWSRRLLSKTVLCRRLSSQRTARLSPRRSLPPLGRSSRCLPFRGA